MVDPNRKINHLSEEDVEYLNECENEFKNRFTENDSDYMEQCNRPPSNPPVVLQWMTHRGGSNNFHSFRGNRGGRPYHRNRGGGNGSGDGDRDRNYQYNDNDNCRRGTKRPYNNYNGGNNAQRYNQRDY